MAKTMPFRIDKTLLRSLNIDKQRLGGFASVSELVQYYRSKSRKFDQFNRVYSNWVKDHPKATLAEFHAYCIANKVIRSI